MTHMSPQDYDDLILHDVRYCLGRLTWQPGECVRRVRRFWPYVSPERRVIVLRDVREYIERCERTDRRAELIWRDLAVWCAEHMEDPCST